MTQRSTDTIGFLRSAEGEDPLTFEGIAVPYGQRTINPVREYGRPEAFAPGAFAGSAAYWMSRADGARVAFRPEHGAKPVGTVSMLSDTPDGLRFRMQLRDNAEGRDYAEQVRSGLNGVSIEFAPVGEPVKKDGYVVHREAKLYGIAGSVTPAYDGARLSLRDMEDEPVTEDTKQADDTAIPIVRDDAAKNVERDQIKAIGGGAADPKAHAFLSMFRDAAIYGRDAVDEQGNHRSFFSDVVNRGRDSGAAERQEKHERMLSDFATSLTRAGDVLSSEIPGAYPNLYVPGAYVPRLLKSRPMANFIDSYPIDNALPRVYAVVTTSTSATVQAGQTQNVAASDFATTSKTATPLFYSSSTLVARQVIDGASPAAEAMLLNDMYEAYSQVTEAATVTKVEATNTASGVAITKATPYAGTVAQVVAYYGARFKPAQGMFYPPALYSVLLAQLDSSGRPLLPSIGPFNAQGTADLGGVAANVLGAQVILSWGSTADKVFTLRKDDYVIFESPVLNFRYEQATGPAGFNVGVWGYFVASERGLAGGGALSVTAA